jgi:hypothetical protein
MTELADGIVDFRNKRRLNVSLCSVEEKRIQNEINALHRELGELITSCSPTEEEINLIKLQVEQLQEDKAKVKSKREEVDAYRFFENLSGKVHKQLMAHKGPVFENIFPLMTSMIAPVAREFDLTEILALMSVSQEARLFAGYMGVVGYVVQTAIRKQGLKIVAESFELTDDDIELYKKVDAERAAEVIEDLMQSVTRNSED